MTRRLMTGLAGLLLAGCAGDERPGDPGTDLADIAGKRWTVSLVEPVEVGGPAWPATGADFIVDAASRRAAGTTGCNRWTAGIATDGPGGLRLQGIAATFMYCAEPVGIMERERELLTALGAVSSYRLSGSDLVLEGDGGTSIRLERGGPAEAPRVAEANGGEP